MNYLEKIIIQKRAEVALSKERISLKELKLYKYYDQQSISLSAHITSSQHNGIIAEFKRRSPSKGVINGTADLKKTVSQYQKAGVSGVSVLTDEQFFGGSGLDLTEASDVLSIPILRKDFIIDPWQIYEAKAIGASAILLIAAVLTKKEALELSALANYLGLEILMELHGADEFSKINTFVNVAGINNRNLKTFEVDMQHSVRLVSQVPSSLPKVAESGIHTLDDIFYLQQNGFDGFLIGENFMKQANPGLACIEFCQQIKATVP